MENNNSTPDFLPDEPGVKASAPEASMPTPDFIPGDELKSDVDLHTEKYGSLGQQALTGVESAGRGLLGPIAPAIETSLLGVNPEDIRGREEENPMTHYGAEAAGLIGPALISGGASALGRAGVAAAAEGVAKASQLGVIEAIAKKLVPISGETLASKIGVSAAKASIENMLIAGSDETSKLILKDPNQSAQSAIANIGLSGVLGATLGAGTTGAMEVWKSTVGPKVSKLGADFSGRMKEHMTDPNPVESMTNELKQYHGDITGIADEVYGPKGLKAQDVEKAVPEHHNGIINQINDIQNSVGKQIAKMESKPHSYPERLTAKLQDDLAEYNGVISKEGATPVELFNAGQDLKQKLQSYSKYDKFVKPTDDAADFVRDSKSLARELREHLENKDVWGKAAVRQQEINKAFSEYLPSLKDFEKKFTTEIQGEKTIDPGKVQTYLNQVGKPNAEIKQSVLKNFLDASEKYKKVIDRTHANLGLESPVTDSAMNVTLSSLDKKTPGAKLADAFIHHGLSGAGGKAAGAAVGAGGFHSIGLPGHIGALLGAHVLGPLFSTILPVLSKAIVEKPISATGLKSAMDYVSHVSRGELLLTKASKALLTDSEAVLPKSAMPTDRDLDKLNKQLVEIRDNPEKLLNAAANQSDHAHYMPEHAVAMNESIASVSSFLNSVRPDTSIKSPLDSKPIPSAAAVAQFKSALSLAQQPLLILDKAKRGVLTQHDISAVSTMYPNLYASIQQKVMDQVIDKKSKGINIPYATRLSLSMLMGQPLDSTMTPAAFHMTQSAAARTPAQQSQQGQQQKGTKSSPALQKMSNLYQTPSQARLQHKNKQ